MATPDLTPSESISSMRNRPQDLSNLPGDSEIWESLKQAIANSSGFRRWQVERDRDDQFKALGLDGLVRRYLRETLETLAY
jgi:hypothetical protein